MIYFAFTAAVFTLDFFLKIYIDKKGEWYKEDNKNKDDIDEEI